MYTLYCMATFNWYACVIVTVHRSWQVMDTRKPFNLSKNTGRNWRDIDVLAYLCHCDIAR